jgi:hypothetical protein
MHMLEQEAHRKPLTIGRILLQRGGKEIIENPNTSCGRTCPEFFEDKKKRRVHCPNKIQWLSQ